MITFINVKEEYEQQSPEEPNKENKDTSNLVQSPVSNTRPKRKITQRKGSGFYKQLACPEHPKQGVPPKLKKTNKKRGRPKKYKGTRLSTTCFSLLNNFK